MIEFSFAKMIGKNFYKIFPSFSCHPNVPTMYNMYTCSHEVVSYKLQKCAFTCMNEIFINYVVTDILSHVIIDILSS